MKGSAATKGRRRTAKAFAGLRHWERDRSDRHCPPKNSSATLDATLRKSSVGRMGTLSAAPISGAAFCVGNGNDDDTIVVDPKNYLKRKLDDTAGLVPIVDVDEPFGGIHD
ncbi:hypothetical protein [Rosistilla oblonga]|uniref:hypothetical protein n=1 Tax=Rosistilla oblonga TaxID=2527990 RepID=UPI00119E6DA1|nr:hypothetical protein [Rosistilla oblonga]